MAIDNYTTAGRRPHRFQQQTPNSVAVETLSGNVQLTGRSSQVLRLDGGASSRNIDLPDDVSTPIVDNVDGLWFRIYNVGTSDNLVIRDKANATVVTIPPGSQAMVIGSGRQSYTVMGLQALLTAQFGMCLDSPATTQTIFKVVGDFLTTGKAVQVISASTSTATRNIMEIIQDATPATNATALRIQQDAEALCLSLDQNANDRVILIDAPITTNANPLDIRNANNCTTAGIARLHSNAATTNTRALLDVVNDNVLATGATCGRFQNDSTGRAIEAIGITELTGANNRSIASTTTDPTLLDHLVSTMLVDATAATITIDLPAAGAALVTGRVYHIKKIDVSANAVTVDADGVELIDGATTQALASQFDSITIQSDGTEWHIL